MASRREARPYILSAPASDQWHAYFGIQVVGCVAERGELRDEKEITHRAMRRQIDFINALFASDVDHTFAIRFFSRPRSSSVSAGKIDVTLLGRVTEKSKTNAIRNATELCRGTAALLAAAMPNHLWHVVSDAARFKQLWQPFPLTKASVCEVRRREDRVSLVTMRPRGQVGFEERAETTMESLEENSVYFIHQFLPRPSTFARLLRMLLLHRWAVMLQITVKPTRLSKAEKGALEEQISQCEQSQSDILAHPTPGGDPIIHKARASLWYQALVEQSLRLEDAPYLLQVSVASPQRVSGSIAEAVGVEMTRPIGDNLTPEDVSPQEIQLRQLHGGGYDTVFPGNAQELAKARQNLEAIELNAWGPTCAPKALGRLRQLVDSSEAACAFRFPLATAGGIDGIEVRAARFRTQPLEVASVRSRPEKQRLLLGENISLGTRQPVFIAEADRRQHTYVIGQTGTGKTSLLRTMILSDMKAGRGLAVMDPHGDLFHELLSRIPKNRRDDVIVFDPTDRDFAPGLNLLECRNEEERHFVVREMRAIMERLLEDQYQYKAAEFTGPVFYQHMQMNMLLAMSDQENPGTLLEFYEIYQQRNYWKRWLPLKWKDPQLLRWVTNNLPEIDYLKRSSDQSPTWGEYLSSKFDDFVFDPRLRLIFGQKHSTLDLRQIMDDGKILLVNLAKGDLAEPNSRFLGMVLMAKIQAAAMSRCDVPLSQRRPFYLYVDEFQSIATQNFITLLSEGRKFGIALVLANQFLSQVKDERITQSVTGNVGTNICFRVGRGDAKLIEPQFSPYFDQFDLCNLPNWNACIRTTVDGQVVAPFTMETISPMSGEDEASRAKVISRSRKSHALPRAKIELEIANSTKRPPLTIDEVMEEADKKRVQILLVENDRSLIYKFRSLIRGLPLTLVRYPNSARTLLSGDWPVVLFCNVAPPATAQAETNAKIKPLDEMRRLIQKDEDAITLNDYLAIAKAEPWSPIFVIPYRTGSKRAAGQARDEVRSNILLHPQVTFDDLENQAVAAGKFGPWLKQLLSRCIEVTRAPASRKRQMKRRNRRATAKGPLGVVTANGGLK